MDNKEQISNGVNQQIKTSVGVVIILIITITVAVFTWKVRTIDDPSPKGLTRSKQCTMEAKVCPDGSAVGRTGLNCEFEACPETGNSKVYSVDELISSNLPEGASVSVGGKISYVKIDVSPDYEGPGGGYYLQGEREALFIDGAEILEMKEYPLGAELTIGGKVRYCGGKKVEKYICAITEAWLNNAATWPENPSLAPNECSAQGGISVDYLKYNGDCPGGYMDLGVIKNTNTPLICCKPGASPVNLND